MCQSMVVVYLAQVPNDLGGFSEICFGRVDSPRPAIFDDFPLFECKK